MFIKLVNHVDLFIIFYRFFFKFFLVLTQLIKTTKNQIDRFKKKKKFKTKE